MKDVCKKAIGTVLIISSHDGKIGFETIIGT